MNICSKKVQAIVKEAGHKSDTIAIGDLRSWAGMRLGQQYTKGVGPMDPEWLLYVPWHKFLIVMGELLCRLHHVDPEKVEGEGNGQQRRSRILLFRFMLYGNKYGC